MGRLLLACLVLAGSASGLRAQRSVDGVVQVNGRAVDRAVVQLIPQDAADSVLATDSLVVDQQHLRFIPELLVVRPGATVFFRNSDPVMHNVFSPRRRGADFDLGTYPIHQSRAHRFQDPGSFVILCHIHPEMSAWVVVVDSPYYAVTDERGAFTIPRVPPGRYTLRTWARRRDIPDQTITVDRGASTGTPAPSGAPAPPR